uniref:Protein kinase domain-containing protein n=1 Tax=Nelumbo nucifera TaxID=4432 RepID=A0A822Z7U7_NELNU|nr:TPA_asm: hypothetical protein HUJ06_013782 [Nelumbo nucifera]
MPDTRPGCQSKCGNVSIPYPFGLVGDDPTCFKNDDFKLFCDTAVLPPKLTFYGDYEGDEHTILHISLDAHQLTTSILGSVRCYTGAHYKLEGYDISYSFPNTYRLSNTRNRFMAVGCDTYAYLYDYEDSVFYVECRSSCLNDTKVTAGSSCGGFGCCQTTIPNDLKYFEASTRSLNDFEYTWNISRCGLAVLMSDAQDSFESQVSHLWDIRNNVEYLLNVGINTSIVLDWAIRNQSCEETQRDVAGYACGSNTYCTNSSNGAGYLCNCLPGYQGNPYLHDGCRVVDGSIAAKSKTCEKASINYACGKNTDCSNSTNNGGYICHCMEGYHGNPYLSNGCKVIPTSPETKLGCQSKCGNVSIPYPFGLVGDDPSCYRDEFKLLCNTATDHLQLMMYGPDRYEYSDKIVLNISLDGELTFSYWAAVECDMGENRDSERYAVYTKIPKEYRLSNSRNKLTAIGCNTYGVMADEYPLYYLPTKLYAECVSFCGYDTEVTNVHCNGTGCCQKEIPEDLDSFDISVDIYKNESTTAYTWNMSKCSMAFLSDKDWFNSSASNIWNSRNEVDKLVNVGFRTPIVLDWAIRSNTSCEEALQVTSTDYACGDNTNCITSTNGPGYLCQCKQGFQGNPYLPNGCQDVNECNDPKGNPCIGSCFNTIGSYNCPCPKGTHGDGRKDGQGCKKALTVIKVIILGVCCVCLGMVLLLSSYWLYHVLKKRQIKKQKEKFYKRNGGLLLEQQISSKQGNVEKIKVFTADELAKATDQYNENLILGQGGQGTVYKGMLSDGRIVAIKKSKIEDESQLGQFINEVVILSQINHRNVVKLLGCCLETEIPLLVYEFISGETLFYNIHYQNEDFLLTWDNRLRIATEVAGAIAYLHSAASIPIYHRDVKSSNILLDDKGRAKVSDFGTSRSIAIDKTHLTTMVQGTFGYLDPEYFQSSHFTDKSDVYSFGVVLVELLTGEKPISFTRPLEGRNIVTYFISAIMENHLFEILDAQVLKDGREYELQKVANIAKRCLSLNGKERPTMKEVALELEGLRRSEGYSHVERNIQEVECIIDKPVGLRDTCSTSTRCKSLENSFKTQVDEQLLLHNPSL